MSSKVIEFINNIDSATKDFSRLYAVQLKENSKSKVGNSFRARCRELVPMIEEIGLVPSLSYCYAKAKQNIFQEVTKSFESNQQIDEKEDTEKGYAIFLYLVFRRLAELGIIEGVDAKIIENLGKLEKKEQLASKLIKEYLIQLKRLSEAIFEEK